MHICNLIGAKNNNLSLEDIQNHIVYFNTEIVTWHLKTASTVSSYIYNTL